MNTIRTIAVLACAAAVAGCVDTNNNDKTVDRQFGGSQPLQNLTPGIWTDPRGCDHWLIDDGVEGYLSARLSPDGKPVCSGTAPPEYVTGPFRAGAEINDPV